MMEWNGGYAPSGGCYRNYGHHSIGGSTSMVQYNWHERLACNQVSTSPHLSSSAAIRVMLVPFKFPGWHVELVDYENTERTG